MDEINIFFLSSFPEDKLNQFFILVNKKKSTQHILGKKENMKIILNEMKLSNIKGEEIKIENVLNHENKNTSYEHKLIKEKNKDIYFLFRMKYKLKNKNNFDPGSLLFLMNNENFIKDILSK